MKLRPFAAMVVFATLAGCGGGDRADIVRSAPAKADWRTIATEADRERLRNWRTAWTSAVSQLRGGDQEAALQPLGALFEPDRALPTPLPPAGRYRCRTFKLGTKGTGGSAFTGYPWFACRVEREGEIFSFYKESGSQRPVGLMFDDGEARGIFLGTLILGDESAPLQYGQDRARDMAGIVQRVADRRWRMVLPYPAFESVLDVIELVPAP